jgi:hypothetical protein
MRFLHSAVGQEILKPLAQGRSVQGTGSRPGVHIRDTGYSPGDMPVGEGVGLTQAAKSELRPGEALVFDWHRVAICCAAAGEVSLRRTTTKEAERSQALVRLTDEAPVYAHRRAYSHLAGISLSIDCRRRLGLRFFKSDLPSDFGLRAIFGRLPAGHAQGGSR